MATRIQPRPADERVDVGGGVSLAAWTRRRPGVSSLPLVIVHGGPGLWSSHDDLIDLLTGVETVHSYDQRGCGRSSASEQQSMALTVADLEALRQHWGHDRWVVLGHSFGADVALAYAAAHPDHTAAVGHLGGRGNGDRTAEKVEQARRLGALTQRLAELTGRERSWDEEVEWRQLCWVSDYADLETAFAHSLHQASTDLPINFHANSTLRATDADRIGWARAIQCPVHVIHGSEDPRPIRNVLELAAHIPIVRKRVVQGAGHSPWVERPDETADLIHELVHSVA